MIDMRWNVNKLIQLKDNLSYWQCRDAHFHNCSSIGPRIKYLTNNTSIPLYSPLSSVIFKDWMVEYSAMGPMYRLRTT